MKEPARAQWAWGKSQPVPAGDGIVRISLQTKGRAGKGVTLVKGLPLETSALLDLGRQLRAACGSGGTVKEGVIEVQGDHVQRAMVWLTKRGYSVKRAGGRREGRGSAASDELQSHHRAHSVTVRYTARPKWTWW